MAAPSIKLIVLCIFATSLVNTVTSQGACQDLLGNCAQMPKALCTQEQSKEQMKKLCAKRCGYCSTKIVSTPTTSNIPPSTNDLFMLYLKNDVKFLKEEVIDLKARLRGITSRQQAQAIAIKNSKQTGVSNASGGQVDAAQPQGQVSIPRDETLINEIAELKKHAQKLMGRIQEQTDRYKSLDTKFSGELADTTDKFTGQVKAMRSEMDSLSGDLKKYAEQIEQLPDFDGELEKVRQDSSSRSAELRRVTLKSIEELKNFTNQFLQSQGAFYNELQREKIRSSTLEKKLADLSQAFEDEQRKTADLQQLVQVSIAMKGAEDTDDGDNDKKPLPMPLPVSKKTSDQDSAPTVDTAKFDELVQKFKRVNMGLDAQTKRTDILTTLVAALSNNLANTTAEQRNIRRYLAYQYAYIGRHMKGLVAKLNNLEDFSSDIINKTISKVSSSTSTREEFSQLSKMVMDIFDQLKSLKMKGYRTPTTTNTNKDGAVAVATSGLSQDQLEMIQDMTQDVDILKKKVAYGAEWMGTLDVKIAAVANSSSKGISDIRKSIEEMAALRNNETLTLQNINTKFQQGISALLGPQRSNATRFFNPRFDWEGGRLAIYGYVAMSHQGEWGTICDDNFDDNEAMVLCRAAGYKGGSYNNGKYKVSDGKINDRSRTLHRIWIDELHCDGTELTIEDCQSGSEGWGIHDCDHDEDIGIKCYIS